MEELWDPPDLPDVAPNRALIEAFRDQGVRCAPAMPYRAGRWELHTHPDLEEALVGLAPVPSMYTVFGISCLAAGPADRAVAAVLARGMSILMFRLPARPGGFEALDGLDGPGPAQGWYAYPAWFSAEPDHGQRLRSLTHAAYAFAAELAAGLMDGATEGPAAGTAESATDPAAGTPKSPNARSVRPAKNPRRTETKPNRGSRGGRRNP